MKEIASHQTAEYTVKKSRFIADVFPVFSKEEADQRLSEIRKQHFDARHHCSAFRIASAEGTPVTEHASDDGEPQGTAGQPILSVLRGADVTNVMLIVTRYFGGTLLGTGGLVRAYTQAAKDGLALCELVEKVPADRLTVSVDYKYIDPVQSLLRRDGVVTESADYAACATFDIIVMSELTPMLRTALQEKTDGTATVRLKESLAYTFPVS